LLTSGRARQNLQNHPVLPKGRKIQKSALTPFAEKSYGIGPEPGEDKLLSATEFDNSLREKGSTADNEN
jgi:hypothetical protein